LRRRQRVRRVHRRQRSRARGRRSQEPCTDELRHPRRLEVRGERDERQHHQGEVLSKERV
jgi:hypothetical protein